MALIISPNFDRVSLTAGEPFSYSYQPCSAAGVPEPDISVSQWPLCIYADDGVATDYFGVHGVDQAGLPCLYWRITGFETRPWFGRSGLSYFLNKVTNDGFEEHAFGTIVMKKGAPTMYDDDAAPFSTYITRIRRLNDPLDVLSAPRFDKIVTRLIDPPVITPPDSGIAVSPFDLGSGDSALAFAAF